MNIFKRPMFFATVVCIIAAAMSLYSLGVAIAILIAAIIPITIAVISKNYKYIIILLFVVSFAISLVVQFSKIARVNVYDNKTVSGKFLLTEEPRSYDKYNTFTLKTVECDMIDKGIKIFVFDYKKTELKMGDIFNADLKLSSIEKSDEYRLSDYSRGIYVIANAQTIKNTNECNFLYKTAGNIRNYVKETVDVRFNGDIARLLLALTTGDKTLISKSFLNNVRTTGISHVIVVSGMHLSIIMTAVFYCLDRLFYNKYIRTLLSTLIVVLIATVCGFTMSIIRASVMFVIAGLAPLFDRDNDSLNSLLTAVTVVLVCAPFAVVNVSFQLSVLSTLALVWIVPFYYRVLVDKFGITSKILKSILTSVLSSVFAVIFTLPVTIKVFGYVSIVSPITNIIISYPIMLALISNIGALLIFAIPFIKFISYPLFLVADICAKFVIFVVNLIAKIPITVAVLPNSAFWFSIVLIVVVIGYMYIYYFKKKRSDFNANSI